MTQYIRLEEMTLNGQGDYALFDDCTVKFVSETFVRIELCDRTIAGQYVFTEINRVLHEGDVCITRETVNDEWGIDWGFSSARRRGGTVSRWCNVSDSVKGKIEKAVTALIRDWFPQVQQSLTQASIDNSKRKLEYLERDRQKLLKELAEVEEKMNSEKDNIEKCEQELNPEPVEVQEELQETVEVFTPQPTQYVPMRRTFKTAQSWFNLQGYTLSRHGRKFSCNGIVFKTVRDALMWLDDQPIKTIAS